MPTREDCNVYIGPFIFVPDLVVRGGSWSGINPRTCAMQLVFIWSQAHIRLSTHDLNLTQLQAFKPEQRMRARAENDRRADECSK